MTLNHETKIENEDYQTVRDTTAEVSIVDIVYIGATFHDTVSQLYGQL
jgi:hypothetical protein